MCNLVNAFYSPMDNSRERTTPPICLKVELEHAFLNTKSQKATGPDMLQDELLEEE